MLAVGVDPGLGGALCAFYGVEEGEPTELVADIIDMPIIEHGSRTEVDALAVQQWLRRFNAGIAYVENVQPMPSIPDKNTGERRPMGAASNFRFGMAVGSVRSILRCCGLEVREVHPRVWKAAYELPGGDIGKELGRKLAIGVWPDAAHWLQRKKDQGRAEAILIGAYGVRRDFPCS